jgi:hypothetical protein
MHLAAGALDRLIRITRPPTEAERTLDDFGQPVAAPVTVRDRLPAQRIDADGTERWQMQGIAAVTSARFRIRWYPGITPVCVVEDLTDGDRAFDVKAVKELGRREGLELLCAGRAE